jgi:N-acyl-phosphatidylethanolamine-hydrolysing phospholipase D
MQGNGADNDRIHRAQGEGKKHHAKSTGWFSRGRFVNPWSTWKDPSLLDVLKMLWESRGSGKGSFSPKLIDNMRPTLGELRAAFPVVSVDRSLIDSPEKGRVQATWIGHSTVLVQLAGCNVLTDPIFEQTCRYVAWCLFKFQTASSWTSSS